MRKVLVSILFTLSSANAFAGNIWCTGKVSNLYIDTSNNVIIKGSWRNHYTTICNTEGTRGVSTITCSLWTSLATTSITKDKNVTLMYDDNGGTMSCSNIPDYSNAPTPSYVMLVK